MVQIKMKFCLTLLSVMVRLTFQQAPDYRTSICVREKFTHAECPIAKNVSTFKELVAHSDVFVDKSLLIYEILRSEIQAVLITTPRGWGKSVNLDMLKTFFEMTVDHMGNEIFPKEALPNYKLFVHGEIVGDQGDSVKLNAPLLISNFAHIIQNNLGRYPTIYLNLAAVKCTSYPDLLTKFKKMISNLYAQYKYLIKSLANTAKDMSLTKSQRRKAYRSSIKFTIGLEGQQDNTTHLTRSVKFLSALLTDHFQKPCVILIDEYDTPIYSIIDSYEFPREDEQPVMEFIGNFLKYTLKKNEFMRKGFVTGQHQVSKGMLLTPNNVMDHNFVGVSPLIKFYGFNQHELNAIFRRLDVSPQLAKQAKQWYNGFEIRDLDTRQQVYHPSSIVKFLKDRKIGSLLDEEYGSNLLDLTMKISQLHLTFELFANENNITINAKKLYINQLDMVFFKKLLNARPETAMKSSTFEIVLAYLCTNGYLTLGRSRFLPNDTVRWVDLRVPNKEIMSHITKTLVKMYETKYLIATPIGDQMATDLHKFIDNIDDVSQPLENSFHRFVELVPVRKADYELQYENYKKNQRILESTFFYISFKLRELFGYETKVPREAKKPDIIAYNGSRAAFIDIKFQCHQIPDLSIVSKSYAGIFQENDNITEFKLIQIYVLVNKTTQVHGEMLPPNQYSYSIAKDSEQS